MTSKFSRGSQHGISKAKKGEEAIDVGGGGSSWPDEVCQSNQGEEGFGAGRVTG
jgi:hypothetical protein